MVKSAFKMACLAYAPSRVAYRGIQMQREQLLDLLEKLIGACNAGAHREGTGLPAIVERELRIITAGSVGAGKSVGVGNYTPANVSQRPASYGIANSRRSRQHPMDGAASMYFSQEGFGALRADTTSATM